jgi:hypothetical protein
MGVRVSLGEKVPAKRESYGRQKDNDGGEKMPAFFKIERARMTSPLCK